MLIIHNFSLDVFFCYSSKLFWISDLLTIFRTLKYEEIYIKEYKNIKELKQDIKNFIDFYNYKRFNSALGYDRPMNVYKKMLNNIV